ncbi:photosystem II reaction center protein Psb28 [Phormidium sp. CCY1219]|uniref:photosystem II reaction center protein Psb28 n=1 Tax=Phormidium sp. CCY1219 TaxID=2886104 RepID=UPI002D1F818E|nr:photosystem II reaction center protein Psb28 [Phormidium sp. CCY1219]MEB3825880.1 photosystem II reaction center protein Psb28 [Phormidium sp. CCY1219]
MAEIQFSRGIKEDIVPEVRLTRSRDGQQGTATFYFQNPNILDKDSTDEITGMYLVDEEGEIACRDVKGKFVNGQPEGIEAIHVMKSQEDWERFMRFMERYAEENGLGFSKA